MFSQTACAFTYDAMYINALTDNLSFTLHASTLHIMPSNIRYKASIFFGPAPSVCHLGATVVAFVLSFILCIAAGTAFGQNVPICVEGELSTHYVKRKDANYQAHFTVTFNGLAALVNIWDSDGRREECGTDGKDSYAYLWAPPGTNMPINMSTNYPGRGYVSLGPFPELATIYAQILWLSFVPEPALYNNTLRLSVFSEYKANEYKVEVNHKAPNLPMSIKWIAPAYCMVGSERGILTYYPNGWLNFELEVLQKTNYDNVSFPTEMHFRCYTPDNPKPGEPTNSVLKYWIEYKVNSLRYKQSETNFLPKTKDPGIMVEDSRFFSSANNNLKYKVASGKWVFSRSDKRFDIYRSNFSRPASKRIMGVRVAIFAVAILPILFLLWRKKLSRSHNTTNQQHL